MARYRVGFEGKWHEKFETEADALAWGQEVGETGRIVHVVRERWFSPKLVAVFPEEQTEEGERLWKMRSGGKEYGYGAGWGAGL